MNSRDRRDDDTVRCLVQAQEQCLLVPQAIFDDGALLVSTERDQTQLLGSQPTADPGDVCVMSVSIGHRDGQEKWATQKRGGALSNQDRAGESSQVIIKSAYVTSSQSNPYLSTWIKEIQNVTSWNRDVESGTVSQEINFWLGKGS